ncbi:ethyl tert-butyl ether degradation protein EthD [Burkholderia cepacia]|uniref:EthD family reductase n=1 Tax=Burkholderia cepacia TaxID=292 RepID=UPI00075CE780|nr:EthD family reductase [Burkholderia cepacia]KWF84316.1 ethyl tert-butyl ether degradation protein EthD [Burkholderia cepacia]UQO37816.1 EthD family reductase [Burkholderia cepacia]UQO52154.1 EthD family reductase [Burkholderia cepacia]UQP06301.1 EthD family reductase [Burkholderia cepacia]
MATLIVSYPTTEGSTFDVDYYISKHIPLARAAWSEFGLQSADILFPFSGPQPFAGMVILKFSDQAAITAALTSAKTDEVVGDVPNFTNIAPTIFRADD